MCLVVFLCTAYLLLLAAPVCLSPLCPVSSQQGRQAVRERYMSTQALI